MKKTSTKIEGQNTFIISEANRIFLIVFFPSQLQQRRISNMKFQVGETQLSVAPLAMNIDGKIYIFIVSTPQVQLEKELLSVVKGFVLDETRINKLN